MLWCHFPISVSFSFRFRSTSFPGAAFLLVSTKEANRGLIWANQCQNLSSKSKSYWILHFTGSDFESEVSKQEMKKKLSEISKQKPPKIRNATKFSYALYEKDNKSNHMTKRKRRENLCDMLQRLTKLNDSTV